MTMIDNKDQSSKKSKAKKIQDERKDNYGENLGTFLSNVVVI